MQKIHKRYIEDNSMLDKIIIMHGDTRVSEKLIKLTNAYITENVDLYDAQDKIKSLVITENGEDYYDKYASAINAIIENEYANYHRKTNFIFHKGLYEHDKEHNTIYEDFEE